MWACVDRLASGLALEHELKHQGILTKKTEDVEEEREKGERGTAAKGSHLRELKEVNSV